MRARSSLKQYFLHEVLEEINSEMKMLIEEKALWAEGSAVLTWTYIMAFSFMCTQGLIQKRAPALWSIITMAAVGNENASHLLSIQKEAQEGVRGQGMNNMRDPWLVSEESLTYLVC